MSTLLFSSSALATATSPTLQPARVYGTHGAGVTVFGATGVAAVAGGTGEYTMRGLVPWLGLGDLAVSKIGSVQYAKDAAELVVLKLPFGPSLLYAWKLLEIGMPWRSPYRPVYVVRMSSAVCAISGVWLLERNAPLPSKKFSRFGMSSRSDGTFGLSRKKWTLSKVSWTTCLMPLARSHALGVAVLASGPATAARTVPGDPATARPVSSAAEPASPVSHLTDLPGFTFLLPIAPPIDHDRTTGLGGKCLPGNR